MTETVYFTRLNNIWESFIAGFQSHTTQHSYHSDIMNYRTDVYRKGNWHQVH